MDDGDAAPGTDSLLPTKGSPGKLVPQLLVSVIIKVKNIVQSVSQSYWDRKSYQARYLEPQY